MLECAASLAYTARAALLRADSLPRAIPQPSSAPASRSSATSCVVLRGMMSRFSRSTPPRGPCSAIEGSRPTRTYISVLDQSSKRKSFGVGHHTEVRSNGRPFGGGDLQEARWRMAQAAVAPAMNRASGVAACRGFDDGIVSGGGGGGGGEKKKKGKVANSLSLPAASISAHIL